MSTTKFARLLNDLKTKPFCLFVFITAELPNVKRKVYIIHKSAKWPQLFFVVLNQVAGWRPIKKNKHEGQSALENESC